MAVDWIGTANVVTVTAPGIAVATTVMTIVEVVKGTTGTRTRIGLHSCSTA